MDPFDPLGCTLALYEPYMVTQRGLLAAFWSQTHGFEGLALFSEDTCAWEGV